MKNRYNPMTAHSRHTRVGLHVLYWLVVLVFYAANYSRLIDGPLRWVFIAKDFLIVFTLFYSTPWIVKRWMPNDVTVKSLLAVTLWGLLAYSVWAGLGATICYHAPRYFPSVGGNVAYLSKLLLDGGPLSIYGANRLSILLLDFTFLISFPLSPKLIKTVIRQRQAGINLARDHRRLEADHRKTRIDLLRSQLSPHFLFNTLNSIHFLVEQHDPRAPELLLQLTGLMQYMTYKTQHERVPLDEEINAIRDYWDLAALRLETSVSLRRQLPRGPQAGCIPPMLLITLLENAFTHGPCQHPADAWVTLEITVADGKLTCYLANSRKELAHASQAPETGVGLRNVRALLDLHFPDCHHLETLSFPDRYVVRLIFILTTHDQLLSH